MIDQSTIREQIQRKWESAICKVVTNGDFELAQMMTQLLDDVVDCAVSCANIFQEPASLKDRQFLISSVTAPISRPIHLESNFSNSQFSHSKRLPFSIETKKAPVSKKRTEQAKWIETVEKAVKKLKNGPEKTILLKACKIKNMPCKQDKFIAFLKNSVNCKDEEVAKRVWASLETCLKKTQK